MTYPAWGAMALVLLATVLLPARTVSAIALYPFLISLVFLGLPHGAWDHRVIAAAWGIPLSWRHLTLVCAAYVLMVGLYGVLWLAAPPVAFVLFIAQSWLHWGQGDAAYLRLWLTTRTGVPLWLIWIVRGGAPILLPIFRFPEEFARTAGGVTGLFKLQRAELWSLPPWVCGAGLLLLAVFVAAYLICVVRSLSPGNPMSRAAACEDAAEVALLYTVFAVANPVLAVGIYFCCWHGIRHIGRLLLLEETSRVLCAVGQTAAAGARFGWQCLPILLAALGMLWGAYLWATCAGASDGATTALSVYLAMIACLTFPHFLLVCWLDRFQSRN
ncbi:MAG: Brp/Blh family beta-carotene 15,15'-dioxygenase [Fibrella sp.]|nr:Brp/Blh family beta-carotene 15,15'-dioxygenase [Armatimonadota bacterium]